MQEIGSLRRALGEYVEHYHAERNHQGKDNILLFPRRANIHHEKPVQWSVISGVCPSFYAASDGSNATRNCRGR